MDSEDDHSIKSMTQQQLLGECQNENSECYSSEYTNDSTANHHSEAVSVLRTLLQRNGAPSIERVWRCIGSSGGDLSEQHGRQNDIANKSYYCKEIFVESGIIVMGILGLIIFAMIVQNDKIINSTQRYKSHSIATMTSRLTRICVLIFSHLVLSPIRYVKQFVFQLLHILYRGVTRPLGVPKDIWILVCCLVENFKIAIDRIDMLGVVAIEKSREKVPVCGKEGDSLPELESEEVGSTEDDDSILQQCLQRPTERNIKYDVNDLPPAFLTEAEYPSGWLVYDPRYGVVLIENLLRLNKSD